MNYPPFLPGTPILTSRPLPPRRPLLLPPPLPQGRRGPPLVLCRLLPLPPGEVRAGQPYRPVELGHAPPSRLEEHEQHVVEDLEQGDQAAAHAQAQDAADVGHEPDDGDLLVPLDERHGRVLDVDVGQQEVLAGVAVEELDQAERLKRVGDSNINFFFTSEGEIKET